MAKSFTSLADIKSAIEKMGFKIGDVWYDGNTSRPVFVCSREGLPHDIEVWAESPKYVNGVTIKDVSARDFDMVDDIDDADDLTRAIKKALAYMGVKENKMKITVKEAKIYTTDDFKVAAEEERFKNRAEIWADQFNAHAEYIGLKDRAHVEKDLHGCDSVVWDYGYIVAKDPFGDKWQVRFSDNAYTLDKNKVTPYLYRQMDSMTGFKGEAKKKVRTAYNIKWDTDGATLKECGLPRSVVIPDDVADDEVGDWLSDTYGFCHNGYMTGFKGEAYSDYKPLMDKVYDWYEKKNFWKEEDFWKDLEALYAHNYPNVGFKFVLKGDDECAEIYTKDGLLFTYSWKPVGRDRRHRSIAKDGSGYKHPGFNIKDDMHYMYDGITGKSLSDEWYEKVSESRKNEASDSIRVYDEDLMVELTSVERYDDRFTDVPVVGDKFNLLEFRDLVEGLAETSNGYPEVSRDGSDLRVAIEVPQDEGDEYREELVLRGTVRVMHAALEQVVEYLER